MLGKKSDITFFIFSAISILVDTVMVARVVIYFYKICLSTVVTIIITAMEVMEAMDTVMMTIQVSCIDPWIFFNVQYRLKRMGPI